MEKDKENIKKILGQATEIKAPHDLSQDILKAWKADTQALRARPLLPKWFWILSAVMITSLIIWLLNTGTLGASSMSLISNLKEMLPRIQLDLSLVTVSSILVMGLMIMITVVLHSRKLLLDRLPTL